MLNIPINEVDYLSHKLLAIGCEYAYGTLLEMHQHRRGQFLYALNGMMKVETDDGQWMVLPYSGVWIPPLKRHRVLMLGVSTRSLYIEPEYVPRNELYCQVLQVSALMHQLILSACQLPVEYCKTGRDETLVTLLLHELGIAPVLPRFTPMPKQLLLAELCTQFLTQPHIHSRPVDWAKKLNKSVRTFSRLFTQETGISFSEWRNRACLLTALTELRAGKSVTEVGSLLGYENTSAFTAMFHKAMGKSPVNYFKSLMY